MKNKRRIGFLANVIYSQLNCIDYKLPLFSNNHYTNNWLIPIHSNSLRTYVRKYVCSYVFMFFVIKHFKLAK